MATRLCVGYGLRICSAHRKYAMCRRAYDKPKAMQVVDRVMRIEAF